MKENSLFLFKCSKYDVAKIESISYEILKNTGLLNDLKGKRVALKANLLMIKSPDAATTTHPAVAEGVILSLLRAGAKPFICDSPAGPFNKVALKTIYNATGMAEVAKRTGAELNFNTSHVKKSYIHDGKKVEFPIFSALLEADFIINLPKLKTHAFMAYSGAVKNMFGAIPGVTKASYHLRKPRIDDFSTMLVDLCESVRPGLTIMDAVVAMEGNGPSNGQPRQFGAIMASQNPYALDLLAAHLIGYEPDEVGTIKEGIARGLCASEYEKLDVVGEDAKYFEIYDFKFPDSVIRRQGHTGDRRPHADEPPLINEEKCVGCRECYNNCPADAIEIVDENARVIDGLCIKCYCCQELCPYDAVVLRR